MPRLDRPAPPYFSDALFRQRERTVDNVKRVYAIVYSFSFTYLLRDIFEFVQGRITDGSLVVKAFEQGLQFRLLMLLIFASTVAVFAYQADKFLDLRYALRADEDKPKTMPRWSGSDFAIDCVSLIATLIPFTLMSYSFDDKLMAKAGVIPFFLAYMLLLSISLVFLLVVRLKYLLSLIVYKPVTTEVAAEEDRYGALSLHWFVVNGIALGSLMAAFYGLNAGQGLCHVSMRGAAVWFIALFVVIALLRNYADFATVWPFLYMNKRNVDLADLPWHSRRFMRWALRQPFARRATWGDGLILLIALGTGLLVYSPIVYFVTIMRTC